MSKSVLLLSMLSAIILFLGGLLVPNSPIMWLASTATSYTIVRGVLIVILIALLVTHPPRNIFLRIIVAFASVGVAGWALSETFFNQMQVLDTMIFLLVSISAVLDVLERDVEESLPINPRHIPVRYERRISITS